MLARIERINLILAVAGHRAWRGCCGGRAARSPRASAPLLACADFWLLVRIGARLVASAREGNPSRGAVGSCCWPRRPRCSRWCSSRSRSLHLDAVPFALGFSVFVVSIMMLGLRAT